MTSKKARRIRLFQDLQKNSPPKRKAYFVLKFVPLDIYTIEFIFFLIKKYLAYSLSIYKSSQIIL